MATTIQYARNHFDRELYRCIVMIPMFRVRRWGCCDLTSQDASGCCLRSHLPSDHDPTYDKVMKNIHRRDDEELEMLDEQVELARVANYPQQLQIIKRRQLTLVEDAVAQDRAVLSKLKALAID